MVPHISQPAVFCGLYPESAELASASAAETADLPVSASVTEPAAGVVAETEAPVLVAVASAVATVVVVIAADTAIAVAAVVAVVVAVDMQSVDPAQMLNLIQVNIPLLSHYFSVSRVLGSCEVPPSATLLTVFF